MATSKRLAITISGAVSLGSYEAGVLYEVLKALGEHNLHQDTKPEERIEVDVLTGASAGGMTAAIAAQVLIAGADRMNGEAANAFYLPWVKAIDLSGLLDSNDQKDPPQYSILASSFVEGIAEQFILDSPSGSRHPAASQSGPIHLGLAMSNLDGIDYSKPTHGTNGGAFTYTRFQDEFTWSLTAADTATWSQIRAAALGCGAFPFAFRARALDRTIKYYPEAAPENFPNGARKLNYLDGGIFQNEPLGIAKNLVDLIDDHNDVDSRFYLFVAPGQKLGSASTPATNAADLPMLNAGMALAKAVFWQARFQDWIHAKQLNSQIELLNRRATALAEMLLANPSLATMLQGPLELLLAPFYSTTPPVDAVNPANKSWQSDVNRLRLQFNPLPGKLDVPIDYYTQLGPDAGDVWLMSILLLERAANLEGKEEMEIYTITSEDDELGGDPLFAFAGFIDEEIRQYDYLIGRQKARAWLRKAEGGLFPIRASFDDAEPAPDPKLGKWKINQFDQTKREALRDRIKDRLDLVLKAAGIGWVGRKALEVFFIDGKVDQLLGLD